MIPSIIIPQKYRPESQAAGWTIKQAAAYITVEAHTSSQARQPATAGKLAHAKRPSPDPSSFLLAVVALLRQEPKMLLLRASTPFGYAKVDKVDAEEARHLRAQYLIHKVLKEKSPAARCRPPALARARPRIGVRLKKLRVAVRGLRARACRALQRHLRNLRRLVGHGAQGSPS
jgi:hypothetical protein